MKHQYRILLQIANLLEAAYRYYKCGSGELHNVYDKKKINCILDFWNHAHELNFYHWSLIETCD